MINLIRKLLGFESPRKAQYKNYKCERTNFRGMKETVYLRALSKTHAYYTLIKDDPADFGWWKITQL
jgi:hypothetical protein